MPKTSGSAPVDFSKSLKAHAKDETDYGQEFVNLPGGISGGVAQLTEAKFGEYKTGNYVGKRFVYLAGVVHKPKTAAEVVKVFENNKVKILSSREVNIEGQRTGLTLPLCETKNSKGEVTSFDDNVRELLNELRKLGGEDFTSDIESDKDLEAKLKALKQVKPFFRFGTRSSEPNADYPNSRVWESWYGTKGVKDFSPDNEQAVEETEETTEAEATTEEVTTVDESGEGTVDYDALSVDELAGLADSKEGDEAASEKLTALAQEAGCGEAAAKAKNWAAVAELINSAAAGGTEEVSTDPVVEAIYLYKPLDPKTKKPVKKAIECEVKAVDAKKRTVDLKNLDDVKILYKGVSWDRLEGN